LKRCDETVDRLEEEVFSTLTREELSSFRAITTKIVETISSFDSIGERPADAADQRPVEPVRVARGFD
jgi:hypothetical protein